MKPVILVVEDEAALVSLLRYNLEKAGFETLDAGDGEEALTILAERPVDLVLLDWMLPSVSGIEVCRRMRRRAETSNIPVIMLTARGEESDRIRGLNTGADDYITKPFSHDELIARIHAVLRRRRPALSEESLGYADIEMNIATQRVTRASQPIELGPTEFRLLQFFLEHPGRVFDREQLIDSVWGRDIDVEERTVDVHIGRLRKALGGPDVIRTVRAAGYALDHDSDK
ncbi:MAG: phosphate regulon transcriptional regulator PhoB [Alphaproteobacteria bacterium]